MKQKFFWFLTTRLIVSRVAGGKATVFRESWYRDAHLSPLTPPGWVFGVVWPLNCLLLSWMLGIVTAKKFGKTSPAGFWMIPLCLWLSLAIELNAEFLVRNPDRLVVR
jgi:tryptophan-rich sensory protein